MYIDSNSSIIFKLLHCNINCIQSQVVVFKLHNNQIFKQIKGFSHPQCSIFKIFGNIVHFQT